MHLSIVSSIKSIILLILPGYVRSDGYPDLIKDTQPDKTEGFPLPPNYSVTTTIETLKIPPYRAWLDMVREFYSLDTFIV